MNHRLIVFAIGILAVAGVFMLSLLPAALPRLTSNAQDQTSPLMQMSAPVLEKQARRVSLNELRVAFGPAVRIPATLPDKASIQAIYLMQGPGNLAVIVVDATPPVTIPEALMKIEIARPSAPPADVSAVLRARGVYVIDLGYAIAGGSERTAGMWFERKIDGVTVERTWIAEPQPAVLYFWIGDTYYLLTADIPLAGLIAIARDFRAIG